MRDIEHSLKVNALCSGVLFIAALVIATWAASLSAIGTAFALVLAVVAASAEGLYAWWELVSRGEPLRGLTDLNIDAMSSWRFSGLRVDSLVRSMWYNPQHSLSAALGLLAMPVAGAAGVSAPIGAIVLAGLALGLSTTFNPLIGGLFSLIYGGVVIADAIRARQIQTGTASRYRGSPRRCGCRLVCRQRHGRGGSSCRAVWPRGLRRKQTRRNADAVARTADCAGTDWRLATVDAAAPGVAGAHRHRRGPARVLLRPAVC